MLEEQEWRLESKCRDLSADEADNLFFPGPGGKSKKADEFCRDCPVISLCLRDAIKYKLNGFFAGTTDKERENMKHFLAVVQVGLDLPPEPEKKRKVYRKIMTYDRYAYLDIVEPEPEELIELEEVAS